MYSFVSEIKQAVFVVTSLNLTGMIMPSCVDSPNFAKDLDFASPCGISCPR